MSEEDFYIANFNLEINDNIAKMVSKIDDEIIEVWKINKQDILDVINFKKNLIKYLESMLDGSIKDKFVVISVVDLLERIKSGKYE